MLNSELLDLAQWIGERLRARGETVAVAESSAGGLISAALLAVPGASAYFLGGAVAYTATAKTAFTGLEPEQLRAPRPATPEHALLLAHAVRERLGATWGIGETGAAGPTGNRYGDPPGYVCVAVVGPIDWSATIQTGLTDRLVNMQQFAMAALRLLLQALEESSAQ
jgi:nicotinamide-nucleotide amidase